jgi:hypothetical protein
MMIRVFSKYYNLAQAGKVDFLACPMHKEDEPAIFPLIHEEIENEKIMLHCIACGYKNVAGQQLYENILERIRRAEYE